MKRLVVALLLTFWLGACKKSYTCECRQVSTPEGDYSEIRIKARKRADAEKECSSHSTQTSNTIPQTYDMYCTLK